MKKLLYRLLSAVLLCLLLSTTAFADMVPKESVQITLEGLGDRPCYATLLSQEDSTGPASAWDGVSEPEAWMLPGGDRAREAFYAFGNYQDPDGMYFLCQVFEVREGSFTWGYYPPGIFRVLLYFPDTGELTAGERLRRYAFESSFRASLQADGSLGTFTLGHFEKTNGLLDQLPGFLLRLGLTLAVELLLALAFGYRNRQSLGLIFKVNLITQALLNLILALELYYRGGGFFYFTHVVLLELTVFAVEGGVYAGNLPRRCPERPRAGLAWLYALAANLASFGLGLMLDKLL